MGRCSRCRCERDLQGHKTCQSCRNSRRGAEFDIDVELEPAQAVTSDETARDEARYFAIGCPSPETEIPVAPTVGGWNIAAVASDFHFGSKYCLRAQLRDFVARAYTSGAREILVPGDWLDGCYRHGRFELSHHGIDDQCDDAIATLPQLDGMTYWGITGNHDQTFSVLTGIDVGQYIENRFIAAGRHDTRIVGHSGAMVRLRGAVFHLWHPKGKPPYALSYLLQKQIETYGEGGKPDILIVGHLHKSLGNCRVRGVHGFLVGCFQGQGSAFGRSLVGAPAVGGRILRWSLTKDGTLRSVIDEEVVYFEHEQPREIG